MSAAMTAETDRPLSDYVAEEVRALRARRQITQEELGAVLGITQGQVSARLNGRLPFTLNEIGVVAEFFETTPAALFGAAAARVPVGQIGDARTPASATPGGGSHFVLSDFNDLRACRDSNPKPSDPYSLAPVVPIFAARSAGRARFAGLAATCSDLDQPPAVVYAFGRREVSA